MSSFSSAELMQEYFERRDKERISDKHYLQVVPEKNCIVVNKALAIDIVHGDNIMILEDIPEDTSVCRECKGEGKKTSKCLKCEGHGCSKCDELGTMTSECKACNGTGKNLIITPEDRQRRPTSGRIVSKGPDANIYELGDRVAYSGYTGHLLPFKGNNRLRVMRQTEPFCRLRNLTEDNATLPEFEDKDNAYDLT